LLEHLLFKGTTTIGTIDVESERPLFAAMDAAQDSLLMAPPTGWDEPVAARLRDRIEGMQEAARTYVVPNEFDRILTESGARDMNATTGYEATSYYVRLPANRAELWFALEADRMVNPVFREFYTERDVVAEERRTRVDADPGGRLLEAFYAAAYRVHPYGRPVIGHMDDIQTHTRAEVAEYHGRYYRPNNAVMAVVGDIDPDRMVELARRYFGPIPPGDAPPPVTAEEPPQRGERRIRVPFEAEPEVVAGWHVPPGDHPDAPALDVMARVLAGGRTGRLYRRLVVNEGLATSVSATVGPGFRGPRLLMITAQPLAGTTTAELEAAIYEELRRLAEEPPTDLELARVRNQIEASDVRRLASNLGLAFQLTSSVAYHGDWKETFRAGARLGRVTAGDVERVARRYLTADNRTVAVLVPPEPGS
ncbi:MAG TPA: pitrilysin family protein, partial [Longimicrobiales bacterium]|nr:pitrilysin family protein [Longimicrobiales bacterium]